jgi:hypothetical protein
LVPAIVIRLSGAFTARRKLLGSSFKLRGAGVRSHPVNANARTNAAEAAMDLPRKRIMTAELTEKRHPAEWTE